MLSECFEWKGAKVTGGYGVKRWRGKNQYVHRIAYEWAHGPIPPGNVVMHTCDNRCCVNPDHLRAGTQGDNLRDMHAKGRAWQSKKTHCPRGHPYDRTANRGDGSTFRFCSVCAVDAKRRHAKP